MSLLVALLNVNAAHTEAAMGKDQWSRIGGEARAACTRCPSPFRALPRGRVKHLFGAH